MDNIHNHSSSPKVTNLPKEPQPEGKLSRQMEFVRVRLIPGIIRRRRSFVILIALGALLLEVIENLVIDQYGDLAHQIYDAAFYVIAVPLGVWLLLALLANSDKERKQANKNRNLQAEFCMKLGDAPSWEDLLWVIVDYAHQMLPCASITLYVVQPLTQHLQAGAECTPDGEIKLHPKGNSAASSLPLDSLSYPFVQNDAAIVDAISTKPASSSPGTEGATTYPLSNTFDLPIMHSNQQVGVLKVNSTSNSASNTAGIRMIKGVLPMIALALDGALLQDLAANQAAAQDAERQKIAQDLHDSLAQNISYLRLKLDQLTGENAIHEIGVVLQELERMRASADEAYQQVRNTINELAVINGEELSTTLEKQARVISSRAGFGLRISQIGTAFILPASTRQNILFIVREALHNIEKHAGARLVRMQYIWLESEFILKITDDGVGFNPLSVPAEGHYGLWIMKQRAQDIGGTLKISPADERGTEVTLWVPNQAHR